MKSKSEEQRQNSVLGIAKGITLTLACVLVAPVIFFVFNSIVWFVLSFIALGSPDGLGGTEISLILFNASFMNGFGGHTYIPRTPFFDG